MPKPNFAGQILSQLIAHRNEKNVPVYQHIKVVTMLITRIIYYAMGQSDQLLLPYIVGKLFHARNSIDSASTYPLDTRKTWEKVRITDT